MPTGPRLLDQMDGQWQAYSVDVPALVADVAARLGITTEQAEPAVQAAIDYICDDTGLGSSELDPADWRLNHFGIPLLAMRMYQDAPTPGGETNGFDPTFQGVFTPNRLYSHLDEYWRHLTKNHGVA